MLVWVRLDDGFVEHDKVSGLHDRAFRLHVAGMCYSARNLTDGLITPRAEKILGAVLGIQTRRWVGELVAANLWTPVPAGHLIKDYLHYNPSADEVKRGRERNAERQAELRERRNAVSNEVRNALRTAGSNDAPSQPLPHKGVSPAPTRDEGGRDFTTLGKLKHACRAHVGSSDKLERAARGCSEADVVAALEACKGPGVRDRLAVALAELKRRKETAA